MCFRPSALSMNDSSIQMGTCPSCGMPVAAAQGVTSGECPHCHKPILGKPENASGEISSSIQNTRIL